MLTVTKQKDMSGFYRHLYRQTMGEEKGQKEVAVKPEPEIKQEPEEAVPEKSAAENFEDDKKKLDKVKARSYRKVQEDDSPAEGDDSDSDMSSDADSSSEDEAALLKRKEAEDKKKLEADKLRRDEMRRQKEKRDRRKRKIERVTIFGARLHFGPKIVYFFI
jgi:coiled-coil domain-containing protein 55